MLGCRSECEFERCDLVASERLEALGQPGRKVLADDHAHQFQKVRFSLRRMLR
jgi:hypothetical protein